MRLSLAAAFLLAALPVGQAFAPSSAVRQWGAAVQKTTSLFSTVEADTAVVADASEEAGQTAAAAGDVSAASIVAKLEAQLEKLREKDSKSPSLTKEVS
jgi:hypothetical protein